MDLLVSRNDKGVSRAIVFVCSVDGIVVDTSLTDSDIGVASNDISPNTGILNDGAYRKKKKHTSKYNQDRCCRYY